MNTVNKIQTPFCATNRRDHFGLCTTLQVNTAGFFEHTEAEHSGLELCFVTGNTRHQRRFRGQKWPVASDTLMVFNARERHIEECSFNPDLRDLRSVIIHPDFINALLADVSINTDELVFDDVLIRPNPNLRNTLDSLFLAATTPGTSPIAIDCALTELVIELTTRLKHGASGKLRTLEQRGFYPGPVARAQALLRDLVASQDLDLQQIATLAGLSKFHFVRAFKEKTGMTPVRYLNSLRVDIAKQKLQARARSVIDIAADVGFTDLSAFNKAFKRHTGMSPTQYRNFFQAGAI
ncbi:MAG: helix-turn-helix transcriptional regulator [Bdellovibrio sp.]|nr:helix-turn-helix transcriptional regulator [Bdellovibrio sp.]